MPRRTGDDRNKEVTLLGLRSDPARWFRRGPVPAEAMRRIGQRARAAAGSTRRGPAHNAAIMYVTGLFGLMYVYRQLSEDYSDIARMVAVTGVGGLTALLVYRTTKDDSLTRFIVAAYLGERRCPACGHDLGGLRPEDDGCTVCPECGAAWKMGT